MYADLIAYWKSQQMHPLPCTEEQVSAFAAKYQVDLPQEFREYLLETAGQEAYDTDKEIFEFFPISRIVRWEDSDWDAPSLFPPGFDRRHYFIFCDLLASCCAYAVRLVGPPETIGEVVFVGGSRYYLITRSFRDFIELYLAGDERMHPSA